MEIPVGGKCSSVACSPCGRFVACGAGTDIVVVKTNSFETVRRMQGRGGDVTCIAFAGGSQEILFGSEAGTVMSWEWELSGNSVRVFEGHEELIAGAVADEGGRIFSGSRDKTVRIWDATTTAQACELPQSSAVRCFAVCGKSKMLAFGLGGGTLKVVDSVKRDVLFEDKHNVLCVSFSPNGSYLATGSRCGDIRVWNTQEWTKESENLKGPDRWATCVSFSPDEKQLASSSYDGRSRLWDTESGQCFGVSPIEVGEMTSVCFTVDGQMIVSASSDGVVRFWNARLGTESKKKSFGFSRRVLGVAISADGLRVASASDDRTVRLWDTQTGEQLGVPLEGHKDAVYCVSFSHGGRQLVSGSADNTLRLWTRGCTLILGIHLKGIRRLCILFRLAPMDFE